VPTLDEFARIRAWTEGRQSAEFLARAGVRLGIGDDAAVVAAPGPGREWLLAVDAMAEEIHFLPETMEDADVGFKALAANVSDIAAMGGVPHYALVSVSAPPAWGPDRVRALYDGLYACADRYGIAVVGGDTTAAKRHLVVSVTLVGSVRAGRAIPRSGARPGESVFVTGPVGLSAGGLHGLLGRRKEGPAAPEPPPRLVRAHRRPLPSLEAARLLADHGWCTALNDISDGLASEAWEIAEASGVRIALRQTALPLAGELAAYAAACGVSALEWMLYGGEDYVLLGTAPPAAEAAAREAFRAAGLPFFTIGAVEEGPPGVVLEDASGRRRPVRKRGYNHFPEDADR
jgi:thiamine-monophosphate kinase